MDYQYLDIFFDIFNLNIKIKDSYKIQDKNKMKEILNYIRNTKDFEKMVSKGYTRSLSSQLQEWCAHNYLYQRNYEQERTKDVDLNQKETTFRKFIYWVLYLLYK